MEYESFWTRFELDFTGEKIMFNHADEIDIKEKIFQLNLNQSYLCPHRDSVLEVRSPTENTKDIMSYGK